MTLVSSKEAEKIFLTSNTELTDIPDKIDIIVSPEFYWVRKFEIPVKTEAQARHVLPTLFEDIVEEVSILTYQVIKLEDNEFLCFAFNNKRIYDAIKELEIPTSNISSIYFAQNECKNFKAFHIDGLVFMYTHENILVKVPSNIQVEEAIPLKRILENIKLSSNKLQIKLYNDVISTKFYYTLFIIFGVLIVANFFKYFSYSNEIDEINARIETTKKASKLPASMLQVESILKRYNSSVKQENRKRESIAYIFSNTKFDLKSLYYDKGVIYLEYLSVNKKQLETFLSKKFKNFSIKQTPINAKVSIKL